MCLDTKLFIQPIGDDFAASLVNGLIDRFGNSDDLARVTLLVNTRRAARRITTLLQNGPARLLPKILTVGELADDPFMLAQLPPPQSPLARKLTLAKMLTHWQAVNPQALPEHAVFDLADSLLDLLDELHGQAVKIDQLTELDLADHAEHWQQAHGFLQIAAQFDHQFALQSEPARFRAVMAAYGAYWADQPHPDPIIVAGSTGSRAQTRAFMKLILQQPKGMVILPGFDPNLSPQTWGNLCENPQCLGHPQAQLAASFYALGIADPTKLNPWSTPVAGINTHWSKLISVSLAPAPLTDQWMAKAPELDKTVKSACASTTLMIAHHQREEAIAIATRIRAAVSEHQSVALISPDRNLVRYVSATLKRWNIRGDESLGTPLGLTPSGILARLILDLAQQPDDAALWLELLKHNLVNASDRGQHMLLMQQAECLLRRSIRQSWAPDQLLDDIAPKPWLDWLCDLRAQLDMLYNTTNRAAHHHAIMQCLIAGPVGETRDITANSDQMLAKVFAELNENQTEIDALSPRQYQALLNNLLQQDVPLPAFNHHPLVSIWGTLEARSQSVELTILGGLNEGIWPDSPGTDAWLSRNLRLQLGLLTPDRAISLAAHDYQLGVNGAQVCISLSQNIGTAAANPSRWITRLTQLLDGMGPNGKAALHDMKARGQIWLNYARDLERPKTAIAPAPRPAPKPKQPGLLKKLSATQIEKLIRNPYDIYANRILNLRMLDPIRKQADYKLRGTALHAALEKVNKALQSDPNKCDVAEFIKISDQAIATYTPHAATHMQWLARLEQIAPWLVQNQQIRQKTDQILGVELRGELPLAEFGIRLSAEADRIDLAPDGLKIYDYKSGELPSEKVVEHFDKQLPIEALIAQSGGFTNVPATQVSALSYISLGLKQLERDISLDADLLTQTWEGLQSLLALYYDPPIGFVARDRPQKMQDGSDYDHLSRYGEWSQSDAPVIIDVGERPNE